MALAKRSPGTSFFTNPMISKLSKLPVEQADGTTASYGGVALKTVFFLLLTAVGVFGYFVAIAYIPPAYQLIVLLVAAVLTLAMPFLAWGVKALTPICGSVYSVAQGFSIAYISAMYAEDYKDIVVYAVLLTLVIILAMLILYGTGVVKVNKKFRTVTLCLFLASFIGGLLFFIVSLLLPGNPITALAYGNPVITIVSSLLMIIIASMFLISDFDVIKNTVTNRMPKKYEWMAAFGLIITVLWLYLKVLQLLGASKSSSK